MAELRVGDPAWVGPFRLRERLGDGDGDGAGGLGPLYLGQSPLDHLVVVRALRLDLAANEALRDRLTRDVAGAREASGPHVAPLVGADLSGPAPWVAWEWVPGESLAATVSKQRPGSRQGPGSPQGTADQRAALPWPAFVTLATELAEGAWSLHQAGVIHGDLTPGSVFLGSDGAVITGFGICAAVAALRAQAGAVPVNTWLSAEAGVAAGDALPADAAEFMSPEQAAGGEPGPASDMFSLGAILTYALTGAGPYHPRIRDTDKRPGKGRPGGGRALDYANPGLDGVPLFLQPLLGRCLRANPDSRPPSDGFAALIATTIRNAPRRQIEALTSPPTPRLVAAPPVPAAAATPRPASAAPAAASRVRVPAYPPLSSTGQAPTGRPHSVLAYTTASPPTRSSAPAGHRGRHRAAQRRGGGAFWRLIPMIAMLSVVIASLTHGHHDWGAPSPAQVSASDYQAGECLLGEVPMDGSTWPDTLPVVLCAQPHNYEVFYEDSSFWAGNAPFPGTSAVKAQAAAACEKQLASYTGAPGPDPTYSFRMILPLNSADWDAGNRWLTCIVYAPTADQPDGSPVTGSVKDQGYGQQPPALGTHVSGGGRPPLSAVRRHGGGRESPRFLMDSPRKRGGFAFCRRSAREAAPAI